ncbi:MAG: BrnT family toxin [Gallionella sp.]
MDFDWDKFKADNNKIKHGVSFELAARVFLDSSRIEAYDDRESYGEDRWVTIGAVSQAVLYVVYTVRDGDIIRIISARKANERERKKYGQVHA